jgi:hypothetical protein
LVTSRSAADLDDARQHVNAPTVFPDLARLMYKWQLPEAGDEVGQGRIAREHRASIKSVKRAVDVLVRIDKAGGMAKQVAHGHRPLLLRQDELRPPGRRIGDFGRDLHARELRQVTGDCGVKLDLPILDDGHRGNAGDWLVIDAIQKIASGLIGIVLPRS